jgi:predicted dehydrogenase
MVGTMNRREFLDNGLGAGAGLWLASSAFGAEPQGAPSQPPAQAGGGDVLNVALIGLGNQGRALINAAVAIPQIRIQSICDVWAYRRRTTKTYLETCKQQATDYEDYRELLQKEKGLHAVLIATPEHMHAEQTNTCLEEGLHVYCEEAMSNTLDGARSMVKAMRKTGKLLQIGYQRRSNPRYVHVRDRLLGEAKLAGRITQVSSQWNEPWREDAGWPKRFAMKDDELKRYGYASMHELRNWRFFKKFGGGPAMDYGAQQIDGLNWLLGAMPKSVMAIGGVDFYKNREWFDNVTVMLEYERPEGVTRGLCQILTTTSGTMDRIYEQVMGIEGSIRISENPKWTKVCREPQVPDWDRWVTAGLLAKPASASGAKPATSEEEHVKETGVVVPYELPVVLDKPLHQPHLENFFQAIRGKAKLTCPADVAFPTEVVIQKINEAVAAQKLLTFRPEEFQV